MKFNKLKIHNIASIADATIDFDQQPLRDEPLFLICGETGSGKSTILDAICLALYKTTPRIKQQKREKYFDENLQIINKGENEGIQVNDPRQYLRRGTSEGFVELTYTGNNDEKCRARIEFGIVGRSQNLKKTEWELTIGSQTYSKEDDIKPQIEATVGFDFEQFCRTTMLAQGEFTRFLKSKEDEKSNILEKLTGTEIYSKIGRRIYEITKEKESAKTAAETAIQAIKLLGSDELQLLLDEQAQLEKVRTEHVGLKNSLEKQKTWLEKTAEIAANEQKIKTELTFWEEKKQTPQIIGIQKIATQWHRTEKERQAMNALQKLEQQYNEYKAEEQRLESVFQQLISGEMYRKLEIEKHQKEIELLTQLLEKEQPHATMFAESQLIVSKLRQHLNDKAEAARLLVQVKDEEAKLPQYETLRDLKKKEWNDIGELLKKQNEEIDTKLNLLNSMNVSQITINLQEINASLKSIRDTQREIEAKSRANDDVMKTSSKVDEIKKSIATKIQSLADLEPKITDAQRIFDDAVQVYEKTKLGLDNHAKALRLQLRTGDICPVCGSTIETIIHDEELEKALQPLKDDLAKKEHHLNILKDNQKTTAAELKSQQQMLEAGQKELQQSEITQQKATEALNNACKEIGIAPNASNLVDQVAVLLAQKESNLSELQQQLKIANTLQDEINAKNKDKDNTAAAEKQANANMIEAEKKILSIKNNINNYNNLLKQKNIDAENALNDVAPKMTYSNWQHDMSQTAKRLKDDAERFSQQQNDKTQLQISIDRAQRDLDAARNLCERIRELFPSWQPSHEAQKKIQPDSSWQDLLTDASSLRGRLSDAKTQISHYQSIIREFIDSTPEISHADLKHLALLPNVTDIETELNTINNGLQSAKGALAQIVQQRESHAEAKPPMPDGTTLQRLLELLDAENCTINAIDKKMGEVIGLIKANDSQRKNSDLLRARFDGAEKEWLKWDSLCKIFGDKEGKNFRVIAQSYVLRKLLANANTFLSNFSDRYQLMCQNNLTILVRDLHFGGVTRPVDLVSGGESFIVSLALALGLSSLNRNRLSADILFIDEGFGTLDPSVLEVVMNTLGQLQTLGDRRVGIISHVEALRERIPVKIHVAKTNNTTSRIIIERS